MFETLLQGQNPHWGGEVYSVPIARQNFSLLVDDIKSGNIVALTGVRRGGKSSYLQLLINYLIREEGVPPGNLLYLRLEDTALVPYSQDPHNLQRLLDDYLKLQNPKGTYYCFLDEIQFFADWPVFVKSHFERKKCRFVITGSNSHMLSTDMITLLSGRTLSLEVYPLSFGEYVRWKGIPARESLDLTVHRHALMKCLGEYLGWGGFPAVVREEKEHVRLQMLNNYAKTVLYRDVAPRLQTRKVFELENLYTYLVSNIGKCFSYHRLGELLKLSDKSVKEYIAAFSDAFLLMELGIFSYSVKQQMQNPKKIYSIDVGQVQAIAFRFSENSGRLLENVIFLELKRLELEIFYFKTAKGQEIDFCVKKGTALTLLQVAWEIDSEKTRERELGALFQALEEMNLSSGLLITEQHEEEIHQGGRRIYAIAAYKFLCLSPKDQLNLLFN